MDLYIRHDFFSEIMNCMNLEMPESYQIQNNDIYLELKKHCSENVLSQFRKIRFIPLSSGELLDYDSDDWDLNKYTLNNRHGIFHFKWCCLNYKCMLKDYVLLLILKGDNKLSTIKGTSFKIQKFLNYLDQNNIHDLEYLNHNDIKNFLISLNTTELNYQKYQDALRQFIYIYDTEYHTRIFTPEVEKVCKRMSFNKLVSIRKNARRPSIDHEYLNKFISVLIKIMNDERFSDDDRGLAAALLMETQIGLRASEITMLETNSIEEIDIEGKISRMIHYKVIKTARGNTGYKNEITYINEISYYAYDFLMKLFANNRKNRNSNLLICTSGHSLPVTSRILIDFTRKISLTFYKELDSTNPKLGEFLGGAVNTKQGQKGYWHFILDHNPSKMINEETSFYYPIVHQFRNTVVTELMKKGVQLEYVRRFMGHLSANMTASYASSYDTDMQENVRYSDQILKTIVSGEAKLLGPSSDSITNGINKWIKENNFNIATDIDEIVQGLDKLMPIRAKKGGVCIKGAKITNACSLDSQTDEFMCASGICPNICHFYFNLPETLSDYQTALKTYEYNSMNGFTRQVVKEKSKMIHIVNNRLKPEFEEFVNEMEKKSPEVILNKFPQLKEIYDAIPKIKEIINEYAN